MPKSVFTDEYKVFLTELVKARKDAGLTQVQLAELLGKPQPWVSKVEKGVRRLDTVELIAVIYAMGLDPSHFIKRLCSKLPKQFSV